MESRCGAPIRSVWGQLELDDRQWQAGMTIEDAGEDQIA
jgi:hypothetical protein